MAHCFALSRCKDVEGAPFVPLTQVDEEIRQHLGMPSDPDHWAHHWYDRIGLQLAAGLTFDEIRQNYIPSGFYPGNEVLLSITDFLRSRFTVSTWRS